MAFAFEDSADKDAARVGGMWVAPGARRAGVGYRLMEAVVAWATAERKHRVRLWANPATPAERLYRRANFAPTGAQKPFPGDCTRSVIEMQLILEP
jgi:GNAT superfamily N-acetyltransferase